MKVSIIIPYKDSRGYLGQAVESCEHQEGWKLGTDYEIIVQHGDCSLGINMNRALEKAKGKFIKACADDDMLAPGCLQALYPFAVKGGYDLVCADAYNFEGDKKITERSCSIIPEKVRQLAEQNTIHGGTVLYRKSAMPAWNESLWTGEEFEYNLRMAIAGRKFGKLDEVVYWYRIHVKQKSLIYKSTDSEQILKRARFIRDEIGNRYGGSSQRIVK